MDEAPKKSIAEVVTRGTLKLLAGSGEFYRGEAYFDEGRVESLAVDHDRANAVVEGSSLYRCKLNVSGQSLRGECTCPAFAEDGFCKHLVAVGLAIIESKEEKGREEVEPDIRDEIRGFGNRPCDRSQESAVSIDEIRQYLSDCSQEKLVEMLVSQAMEDGSLYRSLQLEILGDRVLDAKSKSQMNPQDIVNSIKGAIDRGVLFDDDYDGWPDEYEVSGPLEKLVKEVKNLHDIGMEPEVIDLCEYFLAAVEPIVERFHEGHELVGILEELQEIHLDACLKARPDPVALARRLFRWELTSGWSVFENAPVNYQAVLGPEGLEAYRKLAEKEWEKISSSKERDYGRHDSRRFQITEIMKNLAKLSGDVEAEVAIHSKDLSSSWNYLKIAELYAARQMRDKAIEWAEKGLRAFPSRPDGRIREFLAKEYEHLKRHDDAMSLVWAAFVESPSLQTFTAMKPHADLVNGWPEWREKGIAHIRTLIVNPKMPSSSTQRSAFSLEFSLSRTSGPQYHSSILVEIFLWEGDIEAAWNQATAEGVNSHLWYRLAEKREKTHPSESATAYQRVAEEYLEQGGNDSYRDAVKLIGKIQLLMQEAKQERQFAAYLAELRAGFKAKRNFIKLLDAKFER